VVEYYFRIPKYDVLFHEGYIFVNFRFIHKSSSDYVIWNGKRTNLLSLFTQLELIL